MKTKGVILLIFFAICVASCAKKEAPQTPYDRIQGSWKLAKTGTDDDGNGNVDYYEQHSLPVGQDYQKIFNKDGTGLETNVFNNVVSPPLKFRWKIVNADSVYIAYAANDTLTFYVAAVSSADLTLTTRGKQSLEWYYYTKK
jgi:hypothetical protein